MRLKAPEGARIARVAVAVALVATVVLVDHRDETRLADALFDAGHAPLFGAIALALVGLVGGSARARSWKVLAGVVALAVLSEALQALQPHRSISAADIARDVGAGGAFLLLWRARLGARGPLPGDVVHRRRRLVAAAVLLLGACFAELGFVLATYVERSRQLPVLATFDGAWWTRGMIETGDNALAWPAVPAGDSPATPLARLELRPSRYSGIAILEPYPDWRGYQRLVLTIASDLREPLPLTLRVHDAGHNQRYDDRFNVRLLVQPGTNRFAIPLDAVLHAPDRRLMDLSRVRGIVLFAYQLQRASHVFLGPIELE